MQTADLRHDPDQNMTYLIARLAHQLEQRVSRALSPTGLTLRQFSALVHIAREPGMSSSDLARRLLISPQAANTLIARLVSAQLLERAPSRPRQPLVLDLTQAGRDAVQSGGP